MTVRPIEAASAASSATDLARGIVVGHSNTVPKVVKALGGGEVEPMPESEYDRMYVLVIDAADRVRQVAANHGAPTG